MNTILKRGFKMIGTHIVSLALTLFLLMVLGWLIGKWGLYPFSIITLLVYIGLFYSDSWHWGRLEGRPYNEIKHSPLRALAASAVPSVIPMTLAALIAANVQTPIITLVTKVWYFPFIGIYTTAESISLKELLLSGGIIPIVSVAGYFIGTKNFSLLDKIAFRNAKRRKSKSSGK